MPCLLAILAFFFPRVVIVLLALFSNYMAAAYQTVIWPGLGFFFAPYTTLAYALAINAGGGLQGGYLVLFFIAILVDVGVIGGGAKARRRKVVKVRTKP
jgi:hypothetical protein